MTLIPQSTSTSFMPPQPVKSLIAEAKPALNDDIIRPAMTPPVEPTPTPISKDTVKRILKRAYHNKEMLGIAGPFSWGWQKLKNGETVAIVEDVKTAIRYRWTISRDTFKPLNLGPVDA